MNAPGQPPTRLNKNEYPVLGNQQENILPFEEFTTSSPFSTSTYAEMVTRNPKRTLVDRCLSPSEAPLKRSATSDVMKTPTEFKTFYQSSPSCDTTPETNRCVRCLGMQCTLSPIDSPVIVCVLPLLQCSRESGASAEEIVWYTYSGAGTGKVKS